MTNNRTTIEYEENECNRFYELSDSIWEFAETSYNEKKSAAALVQALKEEGFRVEIPFAGINTAFRACYGNGQPYIGILAEYDALPGLSQIANSTKKTSNSDNTNGHGCGHHLLGTGSVWASIKVAQWLKKTNTPGTIVCYGCPAEEGGSGKAFMARNGAFENLDAALTWHPGDAVAVMNTSTLANVEFKFSFKGRSAHASAAPHMGRSALDAAELMNIGANFLREHIVSDARVHYAFTNAGGTAPNVVPDSAELLYLIRAQSLTDANDIMRRVEDIAKGAALMTGTEVSTTFVKACSNFVQNDTLNSLLSGTIEQQWESYIDENDIKTADAYVNTFTDREASIKQITMMLKSLSPDKFDMFADKINDSVYDFAVPYRKGTFVMPASTDVGDVSWCCPTAQFSVATNAAGTPGHSWQLVAQGKLPLAHKGMMFASKVLANSAISIFSDNSILEKAKQEFAKKIRYKYVSPIPNDIEVPQ